MFLTFQGQNFDIADRTFRNLATTWWLSSSESATDVKELIPEFFFLPEFLINNEGLYMCVGVVLRSLWSYNILHDVVKISHNKTLLK